MERLSLDPPRAHHSPRNSRSTNMLRDVSPSSNSSATRRKPLPELGHSRISSVNSLSFQPSLQDLRRDVGGDSELPLLPPPQPVYAGSHSRSSSADRSRPSTPRSRPATPDRTMSPARLAAPGHIVTQEKDHRKSWFSKGTDNGDVSRPLLAWIAGHPQKHSYDIDRLWSGELLPELSGDDDANCYIHLWPRESGRGPSFRVDSTIFASSPALTRLAFGDLYSSQNAVREGGRKRLPADAPLSKGALRTSSSISPQRRNGRSSTSSRHSQPRTSNLSDRSDESRIFVPLILSSDALSTPKLPQSRINQALIEDVQTLVDVRNVFAFLCGQSLVATPLKHSFFHIFMTISSILKSYDFSNVDGSTFGEVASESFDSYVAELGLADVRSSREKTIEGIVLGERMRSVLLYNEAFTHAAGRYDDIIALKSPKWQLVSGVTQTRLTRASMDLEKRMTSVRVLLTDFEFSALFTGIMNSKMSEERKQGVKFEGWKDSFLATRKWFIGLLQSKYGHWPPKASSKKNTLETSGLNRKVLKGLYEDMASMYDLLVDRTKLTTRTVDGNDLDAGFEEPIVRALRSVLSEYDRSSPPVKPPIPFDLPKFPLITTTRPTFGADSKNDAKTVAKKLKEDEVARILRASSNDDVVATPFIEAFRHFEHHAARSSTIGQILDQRIGHWIFMYVVLQALPMLACDAPGLKYTSGVEYFLCEPPRSGVPWASASAAGGVTGGGFERRWFSVGEGGGVVSLPSDVVEHGVEGIYRRSHCWLMAEKWSASNPILNTALHEQENINAAQSARINERLPAPPSTTGLLRPDSRGPSPSRVSKRNSSIGIGLEALPMPIGVTPDGRPLSTGDRRSWAPGSTPYGSRPDTPQYSVDTTKTFDSILSGIDNNGEKKNKRK